MAPRSPSATHHRQLRRPFSDNGWHPRLLRSARAAEAGSSGIGLAILSNNHVLAAENRAKKGDAILQPGVADGGADPADAVATLTDFVRLRKTGSNYVDCAIATVAGDLDADCTKLRGGGKLEGLGDVLTDVGAHVVKLGRTTGSTRGHVTAFELDNIVVNFGMGNLRFDNQIEIEGEDVAFSDGGDSGSLIVSADKRGVALLFAGGDQGGANGQGLTYANSLHAVLNALKADLAL